MEALPPFVIGMLAVLMMTCFVKVLASLTMLTYGLGLQGASFNLVALALALGLSLLIMSPQIEAAGGLEAALASESEGSEGLETRFRPFLEKHAHPDVTDRFSALRDKLEPKQEREAKQPASERPISVLLAAFLVSELKEAFQVGFVILVPFLAIDLAVVNLLMALGITQISTLAVTLPLKILLFFAIDGWTLISEKLINGYI